MELGTPDSNAARDPDRPAVTMAGNGAVTTYGGLRDDSRAIAARLREDGVQPGSAVAILVENRAELLAAAWAARRSGLRFTTLSTRFTAAEAAHVLADSEAAALLTSTRFADLATAALAAAPETRLRYLLDGPGDGFADPFAPAAPAGESEGADMLYSSGTTGKPKGVATALPAAGFGGAPDPIAELLSRLWLFDAETVYLCPAPLYHAAPLRFSMATHRFGGEVVVMERFDPVEALRLIERHRVTHVQMVPTMMVRLLKLSAAEREAHDTSSLQALIHAAAPCPAEVKRQMIEWLGPVVYEYYSATENYLFTAIDSPTAERHPGSVGRPLLGEPHILGESGEELAAGEIGEIWSEGGPRFAYHRDAAKSAEARNGRGWTTVGDIGYLDAEGFLFLTDRKADMVITGGVNVYPVEVENVLIGHPRVLDCAVFGVPHPDLGEELIAAIQPRGEADDALAGEIDAHLRVQLAGVKCPRRLEFVADLPRLPTGKMLKRELRQTYATDPSI
jgi:long-chain acyl-CoA synthetase